MDGFYRVRTLVTTYCRNLLQYTTACFNRVGIQLPKIEVRYDNLNVEAEAYVGSRGLPTLPNTYANVLEVYGALSCHNCQTSLPHYTRCRFY
jgi:hypothetical protein